jgi:hypothetical protein
MKKDEFDDFEAFAEQVRDDLLPKLKGSNYVVNIMPNEIDIKVAVEIGLAILLDKPLVVLAPDGRVACPKLLRIADHVITGDLESKAGRDAMFEKLGRILKQ